MSVFSFSFSFSAWRAGALIQPDSPNSARR
jgi:hypothetical protein